MWISHQKHKNSRLLYIDYFYFLRDFISILKVINKDKDVFLANEYIFYLHVDIS